jgi:hypothetical protein
MLRTPSAFGLFAIIVRVVHAQINDLALLSVPKRNVGGRGAGGPPMLSVRSRLIPAQIAVRTVVGEMPDTAAG